MCICLNWFIALQLLPQHFVQYHISTQWHCHCVNNLPRVVIKLFTHVHMSSSSIIYYWTKGCWERYLTIAHDPCLLKLQPAQLSVSTWTNLASMLLVKVMGPAVVCDFFHSLGHNHHQYSLCQITEGWPGWVAGCQLDGLTHRNF